MSMSLRAIHHSCARRSPARPPAHVRCFLPGHLGRYASSAIATSVGRAYRPNQPGREVIVGLSTTRSARAPILTPLSGGHFAENEPDQVCRSNI